MQLTVEMHTFSETSRKQFQTEMVLESENNHEHIWGEFDVFGMILIYVEKCQLGFTTGLNIL